MSLRLLSDSIDKIGKVRENIRLQGLNYPSVLEVWDDVIADLHEALKMIHVQFSKPPSHMTLVRLNKGPLDGELVAITTGLQRPDQLLFPKVKNVDKMEGVNMHVYVRHGQSVRIDKGEYCTVGMYYYDEKLTLEASDTIKEDSEA